MRSCLSDAGNIMSLLGNKVLGNFHIMISEEGYNNIGIYQSEKDTIHTACQRTVEYMSSMLPKRFPSANATLLNIGPGCGGTSRYLASKFGFLVTCLNWSENQNRRQRIVNKKLGLDHLIEVVDGNFDDIHFSNRSFDVVWSQDALLHSSNRYKAIDEVARVIKENGVFIFTDIMQSFDWTEYSLQPILDQVHMQSLASPTFYQEICHICNFELVRFDDLTFNLICHCDQVFQQILKLESELKKHISAIYIENMKISLSHWIHGGKNGHLLWGVFVFRKRKTNKRRRGLPRMEL